MKIQLQNRSSWTIIHSPSLNWFCSLISFLLSTLNIVKLHGCLDWFLYLVTPCNTKLVVNQVLFSRVTFVSQNHNYFLAFQWDFPLFKNACGHIFSSFACWLILTTTSLMNWSSLSLVREWAKWPLLLPVKWGKLKLFLSPLSKSPVSQGKCSFFFCICVWLSTSLHLDAVEEVFNSLAFTT